MQQGTAGFHRKLFPRCRGTDRSREGWALDGENCQGLLSMITASFMMLGRGTSPLRSIFSLAKARSSAERCRKDTAGVAAGMEAAWTKDFNSPKPMPIPPGFEVAMDSGSALALGSGIAPAMSRSSDNSPCPEGLWDSAAEACEADIADACTVAGGSHTDTH